MTKTELKQIMIEEALDEESRSQLLNELTKYPREELTQEEAQKFLQYLEKTMTQLDQETANLEEDLEMINQYEEDVDKIEAETASELEAAYKQEIDQNSTLVRDIDAAVRTETAQNV